MEIRQPHIDLDGVTPTWFPNTDFAHTLNAMGIVPSYIEPYLIKVLRQAKERLDPARGAPLIAEDALAKDPPPLQVWKWHLAQAEARKRSRAFVRSDAIATLRRLVSVVSPRYDPADLGEPPYPHAILDRATAT